MMKVLPTVEKNYLKTGNHSFRFMKDFSGTKEVGGDTKATQLSVFDKEKTLGTYEIQDIIENLKIK